jgi:hypothetical protein
VEIQQPRVCGSMSTMRTISEKSNIQVVSLCFFSFFLSRGKFTAVYENVSLVTNLIIIFFIGNVITFPDAAFTIPTSAATQVVKNLGKVTLGAPADDIDLTLSETMDNYLVTFHVLNSGTIDMGIRFNNDAGAGQYSWAKTDAGTRSTNGSDTRLKMNETSATTIGGHIHVTNKIATARKQAHGISFDSAETYYAGYWADTTNRINRITLRNNDTGDYATGSIMAVTGWNDA